MVLRSWPPLSGLLRRRRHARSWPLPVVARELPSDGPGSGGVDLTGCLAELHVAYVERVNQAVAEGRDDLVRVLVEEYTDEALRAITGAGRVA